MAELPEEERRKLRVVSSLYAISFTFLIVIGTLSMAFANFTLGAVLFSLGVVLVIGNEFIFYQLYGRKEAFSEFLLSPEAIADLINFAIVAFLLPSVLAIYLFFLGGGVFEVLVVFFAGIILVAIKIGVKTAQFFLAR